ncbi:MAG: metallophosphoesterase [Candidatus Bipolaricaulota bacterium]
MFKRLLMPLVLLACVAWINLGGATAPADAMEAYVLRVVDGDTVDVRIFDPVSGVMMRERVRLLGFDAPELGEPFAYDATQFVRDLARRSEARLELDEQLRDRHDRLLAHLWVEVDGEWLLVGEELLKAGLARTLFIPPNDMYWDRLRRAELEGKIRGVGLWGEYVGPLSIRGMEKDIVRYVTEIVAVRFELADVEEASAGAVLHAGASRYGFHVQVSERAWSKLAPMVQEAVGSSFEVRGELDWSGLEEGPFIEVEIADQVELVQEWPRGAFVHGPYTGAPEHAALTVSWTAEPPLPARVEYSPWEEYEESGKLIFSESYSPQQTEDRETAHVTLEGLGPDTRYAYRVVLEDEGAEQVSPVGTFRTVPPPGEEISFAVIADTQCQWEGLNRIRLVGDALAGDEQAFDFILHGGDLVESPTPRYWDHFFLSLSEAFLEAPLLPVLGNHERNSRSYYELFTLPPGGGRMDKRWWALEFGDVMVVGLDTNVSRPGDFTAQAQFVREKLSGEHEHRFAILHHPVYSSDAIYGPGMEGLQNLFHPLFTELGVDIVFSGHAHNYERIERDGVTYLMVGGGGATVRPLADERVPGSVMADDDHLFYVKLTTGPAGIEVDVVAVAEQVNGTVVSAWGLLDEFSR